MPKPTKLEKNVENVENMEKSLAKRILHWLFYTSLKLTFVLMITIGIYAIYLDGKVRQKFEGQRWQVPVQVYGKAEEIKLGDQLSLIPIASSLHFSGYKKVHSVVHAGEYALSKHRLIVFRRIFSFDRLMVTAKKITIDVENGKVSQLYDDNTQVENIRLEPVLLDRIVPDSKEDRVLVALEKVPEKLLDTLLLIEDRDFYFHSGISPLGILRALYNNFIAGRTVQGGSTLTQQLVKNMFLTRHKTLWRKVNEAIMALILEYRYSKDQLLEAYINEVYLGQNYANGIYGFGLAAEFYFGRTLEQLNNEQIATLVGQVKGPSYYDPWRHPDNALTRRDLVLKLMFQHDLLSKAAYQQAIESPLSIRHKRRLLKQKYPDYLQLVKQELAKHLSEYDQQSGIRVFTGFSLYSQLLLEQTVSEQLPILEKGSSESQLQVAMVVTDIISGEIKALVGDKESGYAGFNRAINAKRPIGSLIKPAIYLAALERHEQFNLATVLEDKKLTVTTEGGDKWQPKNYDGKYRGQVSFIDGLVKSFNVPTVNLGLTLGLDNIADVIFVLGYQDSLIMRPSVLLGALDMSPLEVNQFYLPIANKGYAQQGHAINHILSEQGDTLWAFDNRNAQLFSSQASYLIDYALTQVTQRGTAKSLSWRLKGALLAGKTGTTNEQRDSWFVGFDNKHLVTTWLGRDDNQPTTHTGSSGALVLFSQFMSKQGVENLNLLIPESVAMVAFEPKTGNAVSGDCADNIKLPAITINLRFIKKCAQPVEEKSSWLEKLFGKS
ncbi:MAG: penicillin-binding protein 1B [Alteromonadaceae bacterium]|jgi:penicillin-binding protein 1B